MSQNRGNTQSGQKNWAPKVGAFIEQIHSTSRELKSLSTVAKAAPIKYRA